MNIDALGEQLRLLRRARSNWSIPRSELHLRPMRKVVAINRNKPRSHMALSPGFRIRLEDRCFAQ